MNTSMEGWGGHHVIASQGPMCGSVGSCGGGVAVAVLARGVGGGTPGGGAWKCLLGTREVWVSKGVGGRGRGGLPLPQGWVTKKYEVSGSN